MTKSPKLTAPVSSLKSRFEQYILPGIIFQSVLIGGGLCDGARDRGVRSEVRLARYLERGCDLRWLVIFASLTYEFARLNRAYDYRTFVKSLIGPLWPIFDAVFLVMVIVIIAVVSAASGVVVEEILGWPYWAG